MPFLLSTPEPKTYTPAANESTITHLASICSTWTLKCGVPSHHQHTKHNVLHHLFLSLIYFTDAWLMLPLNVAYKEHLPQQKPVGPILRISENATFSRCFWPSQIYIWLSWNLFCVIANVHHYCDSNSLHRYLCKDQKLTWYLHCSDWRHCNIIPRHSDDNDGTKWDYLILINWVDVLCNWVRTWINIESWCGKIIMKL